MRRRTHAAKAAFVPAALVAAIALTACPDDPFDPETWIDDLDDPHEWEEAVIELDRLGEPVAIEPLAEAWERHNRPSRILRTIISLADQPEEEDGPYWDDATPVLIKALEDFETGDDSARTDAVSAARALGRSGDPEAIPALVNAATQQMPRLAPGQEVRRAALFALGEFPESDDAVDTLIRALEADTDEQPMEVHGAAVMALGQTRREEAMQPLLKALFEYPPLYQQVRAALTGLGEPVISELTAIFEHEHEAINELAREHGFAENCDQAMGPDTDCRAPGNLHFRSASVLGDMRANEAVPALLEELSNDPEIAFFDEERGRSGPPSHQAILDALARIGDDRATGPLRRYWRDDGNIDGLRGFAIDKYSMVESSDQSVGRLISIMQGGGARSNAAALAVGRLARSDGHLGAVDGKIQEHRSEADELDARVEELEEEEDAEVAQVRHDAGQERDAQRMYEQHKARILVGRECGGEPSCYADLLTMQTEATAEKLEELGLEGATDLDSDEQSDMQVAARERALLDLAKMGEEADEAVDAVLEIADTTSGLTRDAILIALPQIAETPCDRCHARLTEIVDDQEDQSRLNRLTADTRIVKHYFRWAGENGDE